MTYEIIKTRTVPLPGDKPGLSTGGIPSQVPPSSSFVLFVWCQMNTSSNNDMIKEELTSG